MKRPGVFLALVWQIVICLFFAAPARAISSAECWNREWTPEVCCGSPGANGNPLCWDHLLAYNQCCTETQEGISFNSRRENFLADMVRKGATVHFNIRPVSSGRTGAVASRTLSSQTTVLRVPSGQVFSLKSIPEAIVVAGQEQACDTHAQLALGLAYERVNPMSKLTDWIRLLPSTSSNLLWFTPFQLELLSSTFFAYIAENWFDDLDCMQRAVRRIPANIGAHVTLEDFRWALSIVKTRGFAFEGTEESTMLIPLADFWNHDIVANVRTAALAEDALRFVATRDIMPGEELCIDYGQVSNLEFMIRYGFRMEGNPYGGRQFDLGGDPLQAHCPSFILRYDVAEIIDNATIDCHRQARYVSFEEQFGQIQPHEQLREDRYIYNAVQEACQQLLEMLPTPRDSPGHSESSKDAAVTSILLGEIRTERVLLLRCQQEFQRRQLETEPRFVPNTLAAPIARRHARGSPETSQDGNLGLGDRKEFAHFGFANAPFGSSDNFDGSKREANAFDRDHVSHKPAIGEVAIDYHGVATNMGATSGELPAFSDSIDRSRVDQLLHRLQNGLSLQ